MTPLRYRLRFAGRPDLDREFESSRELRAGELLADVTDGLDSPDLAWVVTAVIPGRQGLPDTVVCDVTAQQPVVRLSSGAARFVKLRGRRVFVWAEAAGRAVARLRVSTDDPGEGPYESRRVAGVEVLLATDLQIALVQIRLSVFRRGLVAEVPAVPAITGFP